MKTNLTKDSLYPTNFQSSNQRKIFRQKRFLRQSKNTTKMADPIGISEDNDSSGTDDDRLQHNSDAGGNQHPTTQHNSDSDDASSELTNLAASFRMFSESMLKIKLAELEAIKARESSRLAAEIRRSELESELTRMVLQSQSQMAACVSRRRQSGKRKRSEEDGNLSTTTNRKGAILLSLLLVQCSFI